MLKGFYSVLFSSSKTKKAIKSNRGLAGIKPASEGAILNLLRLTGALPLSTKSTEFNLKTLRSKWTIIFTGFSQGKINLMITLSVQDKPSNKISTALLLWWTLGAWPNPTCPWNAKAKSTVFSVNTKYLRIYHLVPLLIKYLKDLKVYSLLYTFIKIMTQFYYLLYSFIKNVLTNASTSTVAIIRIHREICHGFVKYVKKC